METTLLKCTQQIRGFQSQRQEFFEKRLIWHIKRQEFRCPLCGSLRVSLDRPHTRQIQGVPMGICLTTIQFEVHRLYCADCHRHSNEAVHFLSHPKARITKALEQMIIRDREEMSIQAIARKYELREALVKDIEKQYLAKKYERIQYSDVRKISIDELMVGTHTDGSQHYFTIVRDLESGKTLWVGDGKGNAALTGLEKKLKKSKLKVVTMDMANAYYSWIQEHFPKVRIVFDHFHVIKLMNDRLDKLRRRYVAELDETYRSQFKRMRWLFLRNQEDLDMDGRMILKNIREQFKELGDGYMFKEGLRAIYSTAGNALEARAAFRRWATMAEETGIPELKSMAATIRDKLQGIITYWTFDGLSNASAEGFNNKIRWLMRKAYGFHDYVYLKLKIFQLPSLRGQKGL